MEQTENPFLATLRLPVKLSSIVIIVAITAHIIALVLPWFTGLELIIKILLTCLPVVSFCFYLYKYYYQGKERATELILNSEDHWQVKMDNGRVHQALLGNSLFVHPWLTIISLTYDNHREYFIFTPEIIDTTLFRRLRVRLRFQIGNDYFHIEK